MFEIRLRRLEFAKPATEILILSVVVFHIPPCHVHKITRKSNLFLRQRMFNKFLVFAFYLKKQALTKKICDRSLLLLT